MAQLKEWRDLADTTVRSLRADDVARLYEFEWPETRRKLLEEHLDAIESDPRAVRRFFRTTSALLYGLVKRLTPQRRVLFAIAQVVGVVSILFLLGRHGESTDDVKTVFGLAVAFGVMTLLLAMELIDKLRYRDELELARDLQKELIPERLPEVEGFQMVALNRIANTVGGDLYDVIPLDRGRIAVLFGDASGHGMAAGLVMAVAHAAYRTQVDLDPSPHALMAALNRILCRTGNSRSFFAAALFLIDADGHFVAGLAGHPDVLQVAPDSHILHRYSSTSYPLGLKPDLDVAFVEGTLGAGETLIFHSDGLAETVNEGGSSSATNAPTTSSPGRRCSRPNTPAPKSSQRASASPATARSKTTLPWRS
ncbi:MAG: PP2C family protein-serine/threonine phosphatase [Thermoanaerobaculia bacterium]